jgi:tetraprenyl-beta-curcumene synthase
MRQMFRPKRRQTSSAITRLGDALALLAVSLVYWLEIHPQVRRELVVWEQRARRIPDGVLREQALSKLTKERLNPEAAALFAVLTPRAQRRRVVSLIVAYQVMYDYLDAVNEQADCAELRNGLQLHRALTEAVVSDRPLSDYYRHHPRRSDGGYVCSLAEACRCIARTLPALGRVGPVLARATERCGEAQSHNHAILAGGEGQLVRWSLAHAPDGGDYLWWELAAGGISCLAIHALLACAGDPESVSNDALELDATYFPAICALSALLDSLADFHGDAHTTNHSFVARYRDSTHVAERLLAIAAEASEQISHLRHRRRHAIILAAVCAYYVSNRSVEEGFPALAGERLTEAAGSSGAALRAMVKVRRYLHAAEDSSGERSTNARSLGRLLLQRQPRRRARGDRARHDEHEERRAENRGDGLEHLPERGRKWRWKAGYEPKVAIDQRVTVDAGGRARNRAREQDQH